jgi:hypothetical protein
LRDFGVPCVALPVRRRGRILLVHGRPDGPAGEEISIEPIALNLIMAMKHFMSDIVWEEERMLI